MANPEFGERTLQDFQQWSKLGGVYYEKHPKEEGMMRTRYVRSTIQPATSRSFY